jgi:hypothetical protein
MDYKHHRLITEQALKDEFSLVALEAIIKANLWQDDLIGNVLRRPEHFTENMTGASLAYIAGRRGQVISTLQNGQAVGRAWQAFGRLLHTVQDFYAHTNYVRLWAGRFKGDLPPAHQIEALDSSLANSPDFYSVRTYPWGWLGNIPLLNRWLWSLLPVDCHTRLNLDSPASGPLFAYAFAAAVKRTRYEFQEISAGLNHDRQALARFTGREPPRPVSPESL